jgi:hypothetical protein
MTIKSQVTAIGSGGELHLKLFGGDMTKIRLNQILDVKIPQKQRSIDQNAFYHVFIDFCLDYYKAYDPTMSHMELHEYFKAELLGYIKYINDLPHKFAQSTTDLGILDFCDFMERCFVKAIDDAGVPIGIFQDQYNKWLKKHKDGTK